MPSSLSQRWLLNLKAKPNGCHLGSWQGFAIARNLVLDWPRICSEAKLGKDESKVALEAEFRSRAEDTPHER